MNSPLTALTLATLAATVSAQSFNWTLEAPLSTTPSARERTCTGTDGLAYYMFGGQNGGGTSPVNLDELWSWDGTDWTLLAPSGSGPVGRAGAVAAFDIARGKFVVFGGLDFFGTGGSRLNDTWEWDATNGWVQATPATVPDARWLTGHGTYYPGLGIVFHGGSAQDATGTVYKSNETWAFTGTDWAMLANNGPTVQNCSLVYRENQGDLILHGGQYGATTSDPLGQTWRLDLGVGAWTQVVTTVTPESNDNTPSPMFGHSSYYNPLTGNVIVHGGGDNIAGNRTYQFDGTDWSEVTTNGPRHRNGAMHWVAGLGEAIYGPCNENNGARNFTRSHGPSVLAGAVAYGSGCAGQAGTTLTLTADNAPFAGVTFTATCTDMSAASPIKLAIWGINTASIPITGILGAGPGCTALNSAELIVADVSSATTHATVFPIPADPVFAGLVMHAQMGEVDLTLDNLATSNGLTLTIGG